MAFNRTVGEHDILDWDGTGTPTTSMFVGYNGNVGINTTTPIYTLAVNGSAGKPGGGYWTNWSDKQLKDINGDYEKGLDEIVKLHTVKYKYKKDNTLDLPSNEEYVGFIAQEVQAIFPEAVSKSENGYLDLNVNSINIAMVNAIKELKEENDNLKEENETLKTEFEDLKIRIENLENK